jgi:ABC-type branched-subunit amino acid transport system ATPase component
MAVETALAVDGLSVSFGGVLALNAVSLTVPAETVYGVIGPNGSGKTTMLNAVCGFVPCRGRLTLFGAAVEHRPPHERVERGLGRTFQNPKVGDDLTVRDLLRIGEYRRRNRPFWKEAFAPWLADADARRFERRAMELLDELGIALPSLDMPVSSLAHGVVKMLDLARALMGAPRLILLDESTSGLNESEIAMMREQLQRLRARKLTIVAIEHNVQFLSDVCDHVSVLDAGQCIAEGAVSDVLRLPEVLKAYMGEETPLAEGEIATAARDWASPNGSAR